MAGNDYFCSHLETENGFCINCGLCINDDTFVKEIKFKEKSNKKFNKFSIKNNQNDLKMLIGKTLNSCNQSSYIEQVCYLYNHKIFKNKISIVNKILLITYNILILEGFPITALDLLSYSTLTKSNFLKLYRNNFQFIVKSENYYHNIFLRVKDWIFKKFEISTDFEFKEFLESSLEITNCDSFTLGCVLMLMNVKDQSKSVKLYIRKHIRIKNRVLDLAKKKN